MKRCSKCGETKPLTDFHAQRDCRDGRRPECKVCQRAAMKVRRDANIEEARRRDRERYAEDATRRDAQGKTARQHYVDNRDLHLARKRAYYELNREVWERSRAKRNAAKRSVEHIPYTRREIYERDCGRCRACVKALAFEPHGFQIDHIVPLSLGGPDTPANVQLMCPPCNRAKWMNLEGQIHLPV